MAMSCAISGNNLLLNARSLSFKSRMSPLNPSIAKMAAPSATLKTKSLAMTSTEERINTKKHLDALERLLNKKPMDVVGLEPKQQPRVEASREGLVERRGKGLLEGLNLARMWPEMKAAEEMSPRHLNRLQRLLSMTMEYSPRNILGGKWREYHGCNNWEGMLDPLDENLRREVVRYGEFIQAAYHAFHSNPAMPIDEAPCPQPVALLDRAYKVTKGLYATSSIGLPQWVDDVAPDLGWMTQRSSWIGYVAVSDDKHEIQRMGRRDIIIALRGTATCLEWAENMRAQMVPIDPAEEQEQAKVECGFSSLYKTPGAHVPSLAESVTQEVKRLIELYKGETLSITITGHSLGAALALLVADELSTCAEDVPPVAVFSFGGPRVGNNAFVNRMENKNVKVLRIVNNQDLITRIPGVFVSDFLEQKLRETIVDDSMPWNYHHVGQELRLDTRMSPFLKPNADIACCHDLEAYLHLVDGYLASNCPFRANAKRSLVKLLQEQGSNVKKLYTSKAKALTLNVDRDRTMQPIPVSTCLPSPSSS